MKLRWLIVLITIVGVSIYCRQINRYGIAYVEGENPSLLRINDVTNKTIRLLEYQKLLPHELDELRALLQEMLESVNVRLEHGENDIPTIAGIINAVDVLAAPQRRMYPRVRRVHNYIRYHRVSFNNQEYGQILQNILDYLDPVKRPLLYN